MYGIMIVDDEATIREWVKSQIPWDKMNLQLVAEEGDSDTAWEAYLAHRPKIIITDVNIPFISGLELVRMIAEQDPDVRFIIITGVFDYNTVQASVKLGAVDLISKPIIQEDLLSSLEKCISYFSDRIQSKRQSEALHTMLEENRSMLIEKYCSRLLLCDSVQERTGVLEKLQTLQAPFSGRCSVVLLSLTVTNIGDLDAIMIGTKNIVDELLAKSGFGCYSYFNDRADLICMISWPAQCPDNHLEQTILSVSESVSFYFAAKLSTGIGVPVPSPLDLHNSYLTAVRALDWTASNPQEPLANYQDIAQLAHLTNWQETPAIHSLQACMQSGDIEKIRRLLSAQFVSFQESNDISTAREFSLSYLVNLIAAGTALSSDLSLILSCVNQIPRLFEAKHISALQQMVFSAAERLVQNIKKRESANKSALISAAQLYIRKNLGDTNLNLDEVSQHVGFSSAYFCRLFHREVQVSFNDYLNQVRIEHAKMLLHTPYLRIGEVSRMSGYNTPTHFNYMFKRLVGITPSDYKNSIIPDK